MKAEPAIGVFLKEEDMKKIFEKKRAKLAVSRNSLKKGK